MHKPTVTDADLDRLAAEREHADRLYNEALTALDRALARPRAVPGSPGTPDTSQLERLNRLWQVLPPEPVPFTGWRARLGAFVWRMLGPILQRQQEFNSAIVDHANRSADSAAAAVESVGRLSGAIAEELESLARLQSRLIEYLQRVTLYVDTKDRYETGLLWHEVRARTEGLAAGLSALGDELLKRREHMLAHDARMESRVAELRTRLSAMGHAGPAAQAPGATGVEEERSASGPSRSVQLDATREAATVRGQLARDEAAETYAGFEDRYRGALEDIKDRLAEYLPLFAEAQGEVLDLGCGRGEFLAALRERGIPGRGVDINPAMVERCRALGLEVVQGEALGFLAGVPDGSLGGVFAAQVAEHLQPDRLLHLIDLAHAKLRRGGRVVLETVNPACWAAFFSSYIRDITHVRPIHPDTLRYLLVARGFGNVDIRYSSPYPAEAKLHPLPLTLLSEGPGVASVVQEFNRNVETLNAQLFTYLDYAAVGERQ